MWGRVKEMRTIQFEFQKRILNFRKRFLKDPFQIFDFQNGAGSSLRSTIHVQGIFPIQGSNPGLLHCRQILYCLSHQRSPAAAAKSLQSCPTLCDPMDCSLPDSSVRGDSPGQNTGVGCHVLLQGIVPTQGSNPGLPRCRQILYCLSHQRSPGEIKVNQP